MHTPQMDSTDASTPKAAEKIISPITAFCQSGIGTTVIVTIMMIMMNVRIIVLAAVVFLVFFLM